MYCATCGRKCDDEKRQYGYSPDTGEPYCEVKLVCPDEGCNHRGRDHNWEKIKIPMWLYILDTFSFNTSRNDLKCSKCGVERYTFEGM